MKYDVLVDDGRIKNYFQITVKKREANVTTQNILHECVAKIEDNSEIQKNLDSSELLNMCLEISKTEYEHSFRRAERLDNKVYILLTVCAFIFVVLISAINKVSEYDVTAFCSNTWICVYDILLIVCVVLTIVLLGALIYSLSGAEFKRYDSNQILEHNMLSVDMKRVTRFSIMKYENARDHNNKIVTKRYRILNFCVYILIILVVMLITITFVGNFLPSKVDINEQSGNVQDIMEDVK